MSVQRGLTAIIETDGVYAVAEVPAGFHHLRATNFASLGNNFHEQHIIALC